MDLFDTILVIISLAKENSTRTAIQKICYFLKVKEIINTNFRPHFYGPYSDEVQEKLSSLYSSSFIDERIEKFPNWSGKKYVYNNTHDGEEILEKIKEDPQYEEIKTIVEKCEENSAFNIDTLSAAAKIYYILIKEEKQMSIENIEEEGKNLGWDINIHDNKVFELLESLNKMSLKKVLSSAY